MFFFAHALIACASVWNTVVSGTNQSPWACDKGTRKLDV